MYDHNAGGNNDDDDEEADDEEAYVVQSLVVVFMLDPLVRLYPLSSILAIEKKKWGWMCEQATTKQICENKGERRHDSNT